MKSRTLTTRGRLAVAFGLFIAATGAVSITALRSTARVREALDQVARDQEAERAGSVLGALAREEYLHQAHIILTQDDSHLEHYRETVAAFDAAALRVRAALLTPSERRAFDEILVTNVRIHRRLEDQIRPAVAQRDHAAVRRLHDATESEVECIVHLADELGDAFERRIEASKRRAAAVSAQAHGHAFAVLAIVLVLAFAMGAWIMRSVSAPLAALKVGVDGIRKGDWSTRISLRRRDEFGSLAEGFNHMVSEVKEKQERLVQAEKLAGLGRVAAGVAHELNNPLGVILGYARLVLKKPLDAALAEPLRIIEDETLQCQRIIASLRDHVRPVALEESEIDLAPLLADVTRRIASSSETVQVVLAPLDGKLPLRGDAQRLRQVLSNLIRNAIEASPPGAEVNVCGWRQGARVAFSVIDRGEGIPEQHRQRLFEPFFTTKERGSGLGLSISSAIVRAHGGEISVDSMPGGGTRFTVLIDARVPHA